MKILICSNGMPAADDATRLGGMLASALRAKVTLLGIAERPSDEEPLRHALEIQAQTLRTQNITPEVIVGAGDPISQILSRASAAEYDLVVIGGRQTAATGLYWRSAKVYEVIKSISPPVLVAIGETERLKNFLVCTGGKEFIEQAVQLTGKLAAALGGSVTLLHVMAEPPAIYVDLVRMEEDVDRLLSSNSQLGLNLRAQKKDLEKLGVPATVRIRHGIVVDEVLAEANKGNHDLIVTGTSRARGFLRHYIMGDVTRSILNHASCPVLIARAGKAAGPRGLWRTIRLWFAADSPP